MTVSNERQLKKLSLKIGYLREELYDIEAEFDRRGWQLQRAVLELLARAGELAPAPPPQAQNKAEVDESKQGGDEDAAPRPPWQRKLFRKISSKTHPDALLREELSDREKIEREKMFRDAHLAMQKGDGGRLIEIATELDINIDDAPIDEHLTSMERLAVELEQRIGGIKQTAAWVWGEGKQWEILNHVAKVSGWSGSPASLIDDIISWVDAGFIGGLQSYVIPPEPELRQVRPSRKVGERPGKMPRVK